MRTPHVMPENHCIMVYFTCVDTCIVYMCSTIFRIETIHGQKGYTLCASNKIGENQPKTKNYSICADSSSTHPHCDPDPAASACCTGCAVDDVCAVQLDTVPGVPLAATPSTVTMLVPAHASTGWRQLFADVTVVVPSAVVVSMATVHAPQPPSPHPILVPVHVQMDTQSVITSCMWGATATEHHASSTRVAGKDVYCYAYATEDGHEVKQNVCCLSSSHQETMARMLRVRRKWREAHTRLSLESRCIKQNPHKHPLFGIVVVVESFTC